MLKFKIKSDIENEFQDLRNTLKVHLDSQSDLKNKKIFLSNHIPNQVIFKAKILLDLLLYSLTDKSIEQLSNYDTELRNLFLKENYENKLRDIVLKSENDILKENSKVPFSLDPRIVTSAATSSISLIIGATVIGLALPKVGIASIITGLASVLLAGATFKVTYDKTSNLAHNKINSDVENYLVISEKIVTDWLYEVINVYQMEFQSFCKQHNIKIEK